MKAKILLIPVLYSLSFAFVISQETKLLRQPSLSDTHIAFSYANDIWVVSKEGGNAHRLTTFQGSETHPYFSPDGNRIAFSGQYGGNTDVYLISTDGSGLKRLTWHPGEDLVRGWTPDGEKVVFTSGRTSAPVSYSTFWTISTAGGFPQELPVPRGYRGSYSPDGNYFAYEMVEPWDEEWRNYRGGQNQPIRILNMTDYSLQKLPWENSHDAHPVWVGQTIYFLSDRDYAMNLYSYDTETRQLKQLTTYSDFDIKYLGAGGNQLIYEYGGELYRFDPVKAESKKLKITAKGDFPWTLPHWEKAEKFISSASLSPSGVRMLFEARGDIFTAPSDKGDWRNLTRSPGSREIQPIWSPDGKSIAWFSDQGKEYQLFIGSQDGISNPRVITLPEPNFIYTPSWAPDSKYILYTDANMKMWIVNVETGNVVLADQDNYIHPDRSMDPVWSPDSKWIAYAKRLPSQFRAIMVYSLTNQNVYQLTDGLSDAISPAWDKEGKYIFFLAGTNFALNSGWLDMSSYDRPVRREIYFAILQKGEPSPLLPESDEEEIKKAKNGAEKENKKGKKEEDDEKKKDEVNVMIDFEGINQRTLSLDVPSRDYRMLKAGEKGVLFYAEAIENQRGHTLNRYDLKERSGKSFLSPVNDFYVSANGEKLLYNSGEQWGIVEAKGSPKIGDGKITLAEIQMQIDPGKEWRQIFDEAWRIQRDYLYVENMHGADWDKVYEMYSPLVDYVAHRSDLNYLLDILGGEVSMGHSFVGGGKYPDIDRVTIGLLGADLELSNGYYRIQRIYTGENWNPGLSAPLSAPGIDVKEGDYILEVDGTTLTGPVNPYSLFENKANRQTILKINSSPSWEGSRNVTVVPVDNENGLRRHHWVEENRRKVDKLSGGKLAYVWLPNTGNGGYTYFNRYYFAQQNKQGAIIDERFNGGGSAADYMVDIMSRKPFGYFNNRINDTLTFTSPGAGIWGPKVMIVNEMAGSGGDYLPYMFKKLQIGPLVGTKTWGGLIGIWDTPRLIDGGRMTAPRGGFYNTEGKWEVENEGVKPDIEVEMVPAEVVNGKDPQLERAIEEALKLLKKNPVKIMPEPKAPERAIRPTRK